MFATTALEQTNTLLKRAPCGAQAPIICFLTGSSGCGKTFLAAALKDRLNSDRAVIHHFDHIGVPPTEKMVAEYGSPEKWQEAMTHEWVRRLAAIRDKVLVVFEGQFNPKFALDALRDYGLHDFKIAIVTCDEAVWESRLRGPRGQPALVTDDMRNWARMLREQTVQLGGAVIDTSDSKIEKNIQDVAALINPMLTARITG